MTSGAERSAPEPPPAQRHAPAPEPGAEGSSLERPGASRSVSEGRLPEGRAPVGRLLEDIAFLLLALAIVVLPSWLRPAPEGRVVHREAGVRPLKLDVNRAAWYEWMLLEGIGEVRARRIVEYREAHGPFRSPRDLELVPEMPEGWVERAREHLAFED